MITTNRKVWWFNPVILYAGLIGIVFFAYYMAATDYVILYDTQKYVNGGHLSIYLFSFLFFIVGYQLSKKYKIKSKVSFGKFDEDNIDILSVYKTYKFLAVICFIAYGIWYANFIFIHGIGILSNFTSFSKLSDMMYEMRNNSGRISGITTFSELGIIVAPLGTYLLYTLDKKTKLKYKVGISLIVLLILATFRAFAFSERLGLIQMIVPMVVVAVALDTNSKHKKFINIIPIIAIVTVIMLFGLFEYSRSWSRHYFMLYDSYLEFIIQRFAGYYVNAINTESMYLEYGQLSIIPFRAVEWFWQLPVFSSLYELITPVHVPEIFTQVLLRYGNPEYNNPGGILFAYTDLGLLFMPLQVSFGYLVGRFYILFKKGNIIGLIGYSYLFMLLLELPRYFSLGNERGFFVIIAMVIVYFRTKKRKGDIQLATKI